MPYLLFISGIHLDNYFNKILQGRDFTSNCFLRIAISDFCASSLASRVPRSCASDAPKYITKFSVSL